MAAALFAGAALASCDNLGDGYDAPSIVAGGQNGGPSNGGTVTAPGAQTAGGQAAQVGECLTAYVSLPSLPTLSGNAPLSENVARYAGLSNDSAQSTDDISKSAFPNIADAADTAYSFEAELAIEGGATYTADGSYNGTTGKCSFSFAGAKSAEERTYTLTVSLYHTSGTPATKSLVASASQSVTVGADEASFAASVQLAPNLDSAPNGSLSLPIKFSDTSVSSVKLMLLNSAGTDVTTTYLDGLTGTTLNLTSGAGTIASKDGGLPAGTYTLLMTFMKGTAQVGARTESLNIYPTMQTKLWWTKDGMAESATTALTVTQFDQKEFYVRGTGGVFYTTVFPTAAEAEDTNNGSFAFPLKTIQEAVDRITASGDTTSRYTIIVDGKVTGAADADYSAQNDAYINIACDRMITIKGWSGADKDIIDANKSAGASNPARALYIESSKKIVLQKIAVTGGYLSATSPATAYGGGLFITGSTTEVELDDCVIKENSVQTQGAGAYVDSDAKLTMSGSGSAINKNRILGTSSGHPTVDAKTGGAGIFINQSATFTMNAGTIRENGCVQAGGAGGAAFVFGTFTMKGGTIVSNGIVRKVGDDYVVEGCKNIEVPSPGTFNLYDGSITDDLNLEPIQNAGGVCLYADSAIYSAGKATFNMYGGTISGLKAFGGGGVYLRADGIGVSCEFNMSGGSIIGNEANGHGWGDIYSYGGGVYVGPNSVFNMTGGTISGNTATPYSGVTESGLGGGVYIANPSAKCFISGSAVVGQALSSTSSAATSSDGSHSNKAKQGGGICNHGELYLGYKDGTTPAAAPWTGSVCYNYATDDGGGIISSGDSAIFKMNSGSVAYNASGANGGGVYLSSAKLAMSGDGAIPAGADGKHDVYLHNGAAIDVPETIASTITTAATITPASYTADTVVLTGTALSAAQCGKFAVTQPSGAGIPWSIKYDSASGKGVLKQSRSIVYVAAESAGGSDSNDGTIDHPYATIQEAVKHFSDKTPSLGDTSDPGYPNFENKVYILSDMTFDVGAGADGNAYNFEIVACKDKTVGKNVTLTFNTESGSGLYVAYGQKVKLTNIDITQSSATPNNYAAILVENNDSGKGELWMEDCSIKNMIAKNCSAIAAKNDVHLKNVTVTGNTTKVELASATATVYGPAVYSDKGTIHIEGTIIVKDNTVDYTVSGSSVTGSKVQNVWIGENTGSSPEFHKLDITGALTGSDIGVTLYDNSKTFTSYFNSSGSSDPADFFTSDEGWNVVLDESGNAKLGPVPDLYVSASGNDTTGNGTQSYPYATIQKAAEKIQVFNSSTTEYTIHVEGTVKEDAAIAEGSGGNFVGAKLTIDGSGTPSGILDGEGAHSIMTISLSVPTEFKNLTFQNGNLTSVGDSGGALFLGGTAVYTITNCVFTGNNAPSGNGGAIYAGENSIVNIKNSTFTGNSAKNGGAIYVAATAASGGTPATKAKCYIYGSTVIGDKDAESHAESDEGKHSNSATECGGGIYSAGGLYIGYFYSSADSTSYATNYDGGIYYNYAADTGGGFYACGSTMLLHGTIAYNAADYGGGYAAVDCSVQMPPAGNASITNNYASNLGGGIFLKDSTPSETTTSASMTFSNGTVSDNSVGASGGGGGIANQYGSLYVSGGTIQSNSGGSFGGGILSLGTTTMSGTTATISGNTAAEGAGVDAFQGSFSMSGGTISGNIADTNGGGVYLNDGEFTMTGGTISENSVTSATGHGGGMFVANDDSTHTGTLVLGDDALIPLGTTNNDVYLCHAISLISSLNKDGPVATITPSAYVTTEPVLTEATPGLVGGNYDKFAVTPQTVSGGTKNWTVTNTGYLAELTTGGGTIVIHTPEGDLNLAASATTIATSASSTTVTISATDASGDPITTGLTWNGVTVYYGTDEIDSKADTNSYKFKRTFPKGTYRLNVSVTYKGTTYSDSFTITKTVDGAVAAAMPDDFKKITAGTMKRALSTLGPTYTVTISKDYYMCEHEVTQKEWKDVMGNTQANLTSLAGGTSRGIGDNYPVYNVNWYHAIAYCNKRSIADGLDCVYEVEGVDFETLVFAEIPTESDPTWDAVTCDWSADGYRLPTDMEWLYAALGTYKDNANWNGLCDKTKGMDVPVFAGYNGSNSGQIAQYAWYATAYSDEKAQEVKQKLPNSNGMYDMTGNVYEWCWDWYNYDQYTTDGDITDPKGPASGTQRSGRGGSWMYAAKFCILSQRTMNDPYEPSEDEGFRVVRNAP